MTSLDQLGRPLRSLRLSVTDRCNARCKYCMPEAEYVWLPKDRLLSFEEFRSLAQIAIGHGVQSIRLTGGEPLLRSELPTLITMLANLDGLEELALTTNGILLEPIAQELRDSGLTRITLSLDTLDRERYAAFTGTDKLHDVLKGLQASRKAGFDRIKVNAVAMRDFNEDELGSMIRFANQERVEMRFIEYMDVGGATQWNKKRVLSSAEIISRLTREFGPIEKLPGRGSAPSQSYRLESGEIFGIIASVTEPFCGACDRARITADGTLYTCLYGLEGTDLRSLLRGPHGAQAVDRVLGRTWADRRDQGAVERSQIAERAAWVSVERLRQEPRLEMHTRGG